MRRSQTTPFSRQASLVSGGSLPRFTREERGTGVVDDDDDGDDGDGDDECGEKTRDDNDGLDGSSTSARDLKSFRNVAIIMAVLTVNLSDHSHGLCCCQICDV